MRSTWQAVPAHSQQTLFGLRRGHAGQGPHLGVRELAARERLGQPRQRRQGVRDAHAFAGRAQVEPDAPGQPGRARAEPGVPARAGVELADELEQACGRRFEMGR
jgi:Hepatitis C virus capsid protein